MTRQTVYTRRHRAAWALGIPHPGSGFTYTAAQRVRMDAFTWLRDAVPTMIPGHVIAQAVCLDRAPDSRVVIVNGLVAALSVPRIVEAIRDGALVIVLPVPPDPADGPS